MAPFRYNSYHKIIIGIVIIGWAVFHFSGDSLSGGRYSNGQIKRSGGFENGRNHGKWIWYYENGQRKMEGTFKYGKRNGIWITWDKNGNRLTQGNYEDDRLNGAFIRWDTKGNKVEHLIYKNDVLIEKLPVRE